MDTTNNFENRQNNFVYLVQAFISSTKFIEEKIRAPNNAKAIFYFIKKYPEEDFIKIKCKKLKLNKANQLRINF